MASSSGGHRGRGRHVGLRRCDRVVRHAVGHGQGLANRVGLAGAIHDFRIDSHERGERGEQVVIEAEIGDGVLDGLIAAHMKFVLQNLDPLAGPECAQSVVFLARVGRPKIDGVVECPVTGAAADFDPGRLVAAVFAEDEQRSLGEQVGDLLGRDFVSAAVAEADLDIGQKRAIDHLTQLLGLSGGFLWAKHDEGLAKAGACHAFNEGAVDRAADAKGK